MHEFEWSQGSCFSTDLVLIDCCPRMFAKGGKRSMDNEKELISCDNDMMEVNFYDAKYWDMLDRRS